MITEIDFRTLESLSAPHLSFKGHCDALLVRILSNANCFLSHGLCKVFAICEGERLKGVLCIYNSIATLSAFSKPDLTELCSFLLASQVSQLECERKIARQIAKILSLKKVDGDILYIDKPPKAEAMHNIYQTQDIALFFDAAKRANHNYKGHAFEDFYCDVFYRSTLPARLFLLKHEGQDSATAAVMHRYKNTSILSDVAVLPEKRRRGLASAIVAEAVRQITSQGDKIVLFRTAKEAKGLYKKLGFKRERRFSLVIFS